MERLGIMLFLGSDTLQGVSSELDFHNVLLDDYKVVSQLYEFFIFSEL
jgi:hypothetical protein